MSFFPFFFAEFSVLLHNSSALEFQETNWWPVKTKFMVPTVTAIRWGPEQPSIITLPVSCLMVGMVLFFLLVFFAACIAAVVKWRHWSIMTSNVHTIAEKQHLLSSVSFGEPLTLHFVRWRSLFSPWAKELPAFPLFKRNLNYDWCCVTMGWVAPPWCHHSNWSNDIEQGCQTNFTLRPHTAHICTVLY